MNQYVLYIHWGRRPDGEVVHQTSESPVPPTWTYNAYLGTTQSVFEDDGKIPAKVIDDDA